MKEFPELETPNKIWPFRFFKGVHIFIFFQKANLDTHTRSDLRFEENENENLNG